MQKARNAYDKLTANDKVYVTNYDKLKKAEEKITKIAEKFKGIGGYLTKLIKTAKCNSATV